MTESAAQTTADTVTRATPEADVRVSVVIPCYNGADVIGRQLEALARQRVDFSWEVVVADNGSTDGSAAVAARHSSDVLPVRTCDASARKGINHARNVGVSHSRGRYILLCDADDAVQDGWLAAMDAAFSAGARLVGGRLIRVTADDRPVGVGEEGMRNDLEFLPWPQGANCGFARAVYDEVGPFDEDYLGGGDEADFFWRAQVRGDELVYVPEAAIRYTERPSSKARFRQHYRYGRSHAQLFHAFAADGMPRSSTAYALWFWTTIWSRLAASVLVRRWRRHAVAHLAQRCGRLGGSLAYRVWYL